MRPSTQDLLVCPTCRGPLEWFGEPGQATTGGVLVCPADRLPYPIHNGIPEFIHPDRIGGLNQRFSTLYDVGSVFYRPAVKVSLALLGISEQRARRDVLDRLQPNGGKVLEVSIGPGSNLPYLVDRPDVGEIVGLDISPGQLRQCASYARRKGWSVDLVLGNAEHLPFADDSFEVAFHIGGINFFDDKAAALAELARVAKPGSRVLVVDESERGAQLYEKFPFFNRIFTDEPRLRVTPPVDDLPAGVSDVEVRDVWNGWAYCLEFTVD